MLTDVWRMQMFAQEEAHGSWRAQPGRASYLQGTSGWTHTEVWSQHTVWHLQNEMPYLRALWKPLFQTNLTDHILYSTEQIAPSLVITLEFFLHVLQMVKWQISSLWQPTQAFINLLVPSVSNTALSSNLVFMTVLWPTAPIVMFNPMLPFSHCYFQGLHKIPLDSQLPLHQWLEMTMRPLLTGQTELLVWKAVLAVYWYDFYISGQKHVTLVYSTSSFSVGNPQYLLVNIITLYSSHITSPGYEDMLVLTINKDRTNPLLGPCFKWKWVQNNLLPC